VGGRVPFINACRLDQVAVHQSMQHQQSYSKWVISESFQWQKILERIQKYFFIKNITSNI